MLTLSPSRRMGSVFHVGVGVETGRDTFEAMLAAAAAARADLDSPVAHLAIVVTTSAPRDDVARAIRGVVGPVGITGGVTSALLTERGLVTEGALVILASNGDGAASGVAATNGRKLGDAAQAAARLMLAGRPFREAYPRGVSLAFTAHGSGAPAAEFLRPWRELMGPKMRTVCGVLSSATVFGASSTPALASVGCLEAPYQIGLGLAEGMLPDHDADVNIHGSVEATRSALKGLEERPARLVLTLASTARYRTLGAAVGREWSAIREQVRQHDERTDPPCVGWLCDEVAAYGRGVHPVDVPGALVVAALGDPTRDQDQLSWPRPVSIRHA